MCLGCYRVCYYRECHEVVIYTLILPYWQVSSSFVELLSPLITFTPFAPRSAITCMAFVGDTWPNLLADGAAIGKPLADNNLCAMGWAGHRIPTVPVLAVTAVGIKGDERVIIVSGPGQNLFERALNTFNSSALNCTNLIAASGLSMCTIKGSVRGRPLATNIDRTAFASSALAPNPYTV